MRLVAASRLISIFAATLALGACVVDEWSDEPTTAVPAVSATNVPATATTRAGATLYAPEDTDASAADAGTRTAKSSIKAFGGGTIRGTAVLRQRGDDVVVELDLTSCSEGSHLVQIFSGYSCDSVQSQGSVWNPPRGENLGSEAGTISCGSDKKGSLTFTRPGGNPRTSWTVGDRSPTTDVTRGLIVVFAANDPSQRHACGDFL